MEKFDILVKTPLGLEEVAASYIEELEEGVKVFPKPNGYPGLVLVSNSKDKRSLRALIKEKVPEAEKVIPVEYCVKATLDDIKNAAVSLAKSVISSEDCFAVKTVRRGRHNFTSVDINVRIGASIKEATNATVDLEYPDKVIAIEVIDDMALVGHLSGKELYKKTDKDKFSVLPYLNKIAIIHLPYLGSPTAAKTIGVRIGRNCQTFEVKELTIALTSYVKANELMHFISGVYEGIKSRYSIQKRVYAHSPQKVQVYVEDLYQLIRRRRKEPIIVLEPEGVTITKVREKVFEILSMDTDRINVLIGSREGIPTGVYRFADLVLDICPGVTISTDNATTSAIIAFATIIEEKLQEKARDN